MHATQWPNQFPFNCKSSTQNAPKLIFLSSNIEKITPPPLGRGTANPHTLPLIAFGASILAPAALDTCAFGARPPSFSCFTPGSWGASWNTGPCYMWHVAIGRICVQAMRPKNNKKWRYGENGIAIIVSMCNKNNSTKLSTSKTLILYYSPNNY